MKLTASRATSDDLEALERLDAGLRGTYASLRGGSLYTLRNLREEPVGESYAVALSEEDCLVLIGWVGDHAGGFAAANLVDLDDGYRLVELTEIFVEPEFRDVGLGAELMKMVLHWSREKGADGIDSQAMPGDRGTKNFFESNGLVARAIKVHLSLGEQ